MIPMALQFITIILLAAFIYVLVKYQTVKKDMNSMAAVMLHESNELTSILQNINVYYLLIDRDFVVHNTNYYALNHLTPVEGERKKVGDLLHCRNAIAAGECGKHEQCKLCCIRTFIGKAFYEKRGFKKLDASMKLLSDDGKSIISCDVSVSGAYLLHINGEERMVLTVYDVTELRNIQRLLDVERENAISADKLKSAFIANMSHEVRTPLNAIVGFSGLMATATSEEEKKMYTDIISENNERLLRVVNDIFDLSQIDAGVLNFVYSEFDANDLLRELEGVFGMKLNENPLVALICEAHLEPIMMHSEKQRIIQVLTNLLHNAMKFTKTGEIRFGCRMEGTDEVCFYVSDTGIGIPEEEQEKIFSHFTKLDREVQGTGLGLTLSETIIHNLGGRVGVKSELGKGGTFWFILPLITKKGVA